MGSTNEGIFFISFLTNPGKVWKRSKKGKIPKDYVVSNPRIMWSWFLDHGPWWLWSKKKPGPGWLAHTPLAGTGDRMGDFAVITIQL